MPNKTAEIRNAEIRELFEDAPQLVEYKIQAMPEDIPIRGNVLASGDPVADRAAELEVERRLEAGNPWAWCTVRVIARMKGTQLMGDAYLGGCSFEDEADFITSGYYEDLRSEAVEHLIGETAVLMGLVEEVLENE